MRPFLFLQNAILLFFFSANLALANETKPAKAATSGTFSKDSNAAAPSRTNNETPTKNTPKKLIVLGDSLTEGYGVAKDAAYPALLEKKLHDSGKKNWSVINSGVSGSTTASAISRMKWLFKSKPEIVLLALGANDGLRGIDVKASEQNLADAIEYAQTEKVKVILAGLYMPPNYGKDYTADFKKMYIDLAKKYKLTLIPFLLENVAGDSKKNLADGIHPNESGHKVIAETVFKTIQGVL